MKKTIKELKQICKDRKITGFYTKKKYDLVRVNGKNTQSFTDEECECSATNGLE